MNQPHHLPVRPHYKHGKVAPFVAALFVAFLLGAGPILAGIVINIIACM